MVTLIADPVGSPTSASASASRAAVSRRAGLRLGLALLAAPYLGHTARAQKPEARDEGAATAQLASRPGTSPDAAGRRVSDLAAGAHGSPVRLDMEPIAAARQAIIDCQTRYARVEDYTCTFHKRERIEGKLIAPHVMKMKARSRPHSIYMKFETPNKGREAIYVAGRNKGHVLAHDVGLFRVLAGTMTLDPKGEMAMDECRHPITEAGLGPLIDTVAKHWAYELTPEGAVVSIHPGMTIGPRTVTLIESTHPTKRSDYLFHKVKLYIDHGLGLPIRFEAYDWPKSVGGTPDLVEEYTYVDLKLNVGLTDKDFDPNNRAYAFGRF
ncbi:MAG: DUF1571 domain-containing protein [Isosphaeraceae bacterium]